MATKAGRNAPQLPADWNALTIGTRPQEQLGDLVPQDHQTGGYYGAGTLDNQGKFNSKSMVPMDYNMVGLLNDLLEDTLAQGSTEGLNVGLYEGQSGDWVPYTSITHYSPDSLASVSVLNPDIYGPGFDFGAANVATYYLPGSDEAVIGLQNGGPAIGIVNVASPAGRGNPAVGGPAWHKIVQKYIDGTPYDEMLMRHFFGQLIYGYGPQLRDHQIDVHAIQVGELGQPGYHVMYIPVFGDDAGMNGEIPVTGWLRERLLHAPGIMHDVAVAHAEKFKSPDQKKLGRYGAANSALRHMGEGDSVLVTPDQLAGIQEAMATGGSARGLFTYKPGKRKNTDRRGSYNPLRSPTGDAIVSGNKNAGECNVYSGLPGHTGQARFGYRGFNFYKKGKTYADGRTVYHCGASPAYATNQHRAIYQPGGARGGDIGLTAALERTDFKPAELDEMYEDWTNDPEKYGTSETLVIPGVGFSRGALLQQGVPKEEYANVNLNKAFRQRKGNRTLQRLGLAGQ